MYIVYAYFIFTVAAVLYLMNVKYRLIVNFKSCQKLQLLLVQILMHAVNWFDCRAIFLWLCSKDLTKLNFDNVQKGSPEEILMNLQQGQTTYAVVFEILCR